MLKHVDGGGGGGRAAPKPPSLHWPLFVAEHVFVHRVMPPSGNRGGGKGGGGLGGDGGGDGGGVSTTFDPGSGSEDEVDADVNAGWMRWGVWCWFVVGDGMAKVLSF